MFTLLLSLQFNEENVECIKRILFYHSQSGFLWDLLIYFQRYYDFLKKYLNVKRRRLTRQDWREHPMDGRRLGLEAVDNFANFAPW